MMRAKNYKKLFSEWLEPDKPLFSLPSSNPATSILEKLSAPPEIFTIYSQVAAISIAPAEHYVMPPIENIRSFSLNFTSKYTRVRKDLDGKYFYFLSDLPGYAYGWSRVPLIAGARIVFLELDRFDRSSTTQPEHEFILPIVGETLWKYLTEEIQAW